MGGFEGLGVLRASRNFEKFSKVLKITEKTGF